MQIRVYKGTIYATTMFIMGVCNPKGETDSYNGLYLTQREMQHMVDSRKLLNLPVKTEHVGNAIGNIVSAYMNTQGQLQCVMELNTKNQQNEPASVVSGFIKDGVALELSLGYVVDVEHSDQKLHAGDKRVLEVSVVKKGARSGCYIMAYEENGKTFVNQHASTLKSDWENFCSLK